MKKAYFLYPLPVLLAGIFLQYSGLDFFLERPFYDTTLKLWTYKSSWLASNVLHTGGRDLVAVVDALVLSVFVLSFFVEKLSPYRKASAFLLIASLAGPALVALGKHFTHIYSPWNLDVFGGAEPFIRLFDAVPKGAKPGHAFPAGHSSGGFAFFSLFFLALEYRPSLRHCGLWLALLIGFTFGIAQQARGAHFLSHDFFSLAVCWYAALMTYLIFYKIAWNGIPAGTIKLDVNRSGDHYEIKASARTAKFIFRDHFILRPPAAANTIKSRADTAAAAEPK